jgi:hypothetical protein
LLIVASTLATLLPACGLSLSVHVHAAWNCSMAISGLCSREQAPYSMHTQTHMDTACIWRPDAELHTRRTRPPLGAGESINQARGPSNITPGYTQTRTQHTRWTARKRCAVWQEACKAGGRQSQQGLSLRTALTGAHTTQQLLTTATTGRRQPAQPGLPTTRRLSSLHCS